MPTFSPAYLASWTGGQWTSRPTVPLHGFTQDSRKLKSGQVFVALKTEKRDGHDFLPDALAAGASAALVSRADPALTLPQLVAADPLRAFQTIAREHRRSFRGSIAGVTGSAGKTSTKNLLAKLLGGEPLVLSTEGNLNNHLGVPLTLTRLEPGAHEAGVIEAGISAPGEMDELASMIEPDYGIVTLVAPAHVEELGSLDGVAREKAALLHHLRPPGLGVFPKQCWDFAAFQDLPQTSIVAVPEGERISAPRVVYFGLNQTPAASELLIGGRRRFTCRRVSRGMAQNAVLAILLASEMGISDDAIQRHLLEWEPAKWRGELRQEQGRTIYLDFYNANPASMADALENFYTVASASQPRMLILGCMEELGAEAARYHVDLGRSLQIRPQDRVYLIGGEAESVRSGAREAGIPAECIEVVDTAAPLAEKVRAFQGAVFIKGSRRYALENALPPPAEKPASGGGGGSGGTGSSYFSWTRSPVAGSTSWSFPRTSAVRIVRPSSHPFQ